MIQPDKKVVLRKGQLIRVCKNEDCSSYIGYAVLVEPMDEGVTVVEGKENEFDNDWVFLKQKWKVEYVREDQLPPFCSDEEIFSQKYLEGKQTFVYLYEHIGKWREFKSTIVENPEDVK